MRFADEFDVQVPAASDLQPRTAPLEEAGSRPGRSWADDLELARRVTMAVLITAADPETRLRMAREIHDGSRRAAHPFFLVDARRERPTGSEGAWLQILAAAGHGTLFIDGLEHLNDVHGLRFVTTYCASGPHGVVTPRLITGAGAGLRNGTFPAPLFYRLNTIHISVP